MFFFNFFTSGCANKDGQFEVVFIVEDEEYYSAKVKITQSITYRKNRLRRGILLKVGTLVTAGR